MTDSNRNVMTNVKNTLATGRIHRLWATGHYVFLTGGIILGLWAFYLQEIKEISNKEAQIGFVCSFIPWFLYRLITSWIAWIKSGIFYFDNPFGGPEMHRKDQEDTK